VTENAEQDNAIRVFISYSHDSIALVETVWELCQNLREKGIDCTIDQHIDVPLQGWPAWMLEQIRDSDYVLIIVTKQYNEKLTKGRVEGFGKGAVWEGGIILNNIYQDYGENKKFLPLLLDEESNQYMPDFLQPYTYFLMPRDLIKLFRHITNQPERTPIPIGEIYRLILSNKEIFENFGPKNVGYDFDYDLWKAQREDILKNNDEIKKLMGLLTNISEKSKKIFDTELNHIRAFKAHATNTKIKYEKFKYTEEFEREISNLINE
jgi:TIR domain